MKTTLCSAIVLAFALLAIGQAAELVDQNPQCSRWLSGPNKDALRTYLCQPNSVRCACSCNEECRTKAASRSQVAPASQPSSDRIKACCTAVGVKPECMPLCKYNASQSELMCLTGKCYNDLKKWMYCAADTANTGPNEQCCTTQGLPDNCRPFCQGTTPPVQQLIGLTYFPCLQGANTILKCHLDNLPAKSNYQQDRRVFANETITPDQARLLAAVAGHC